MDFKDYVNLKISETQDLMQRYELQTSDPALAGYRLYTQADRGVLRYRYVTDDNPHPKYLGWRNDSQLLRRLLERENAKSRLSDTAANLHLLQNFLSEYNFNAEYFPDNQASALLDRNGKKLYPRSENPYKREQLIHDTGLGFFTRTKSEAIVAERLHLQGYDFQYEKRLPLSKVIGWRRNMYPDFTIFLPDGRKKYLEHVGMLQDDGYQNDFFQRLLEYHANDILLGRDLFITMDGPDRSIDVGSIDRLLQAICLL